MAKRYTTCALYSDAGTGSGLNPFSLAEYDEHCAAGSKATKVTHTCAASHVPDAVKKDIAGKCTLRNGRYVLDAECMQALAKVPDFSGYVASPADPLFEEAQVCRTKLNGDFHAMCGAKEVTYDDMRAAVGAKCDQCCETVVEKEVKEAKGTKETTHKGKHDQTPAGHGHTPGYIPFQV